MRLRTWRPGVFSVRLLLQIFAVGFIIFILVKHIDAIFSSRFFNEHKPQHVYFELPYNIF